MPRTFANILIIDDNEIRCRSIIEPLEQWGWYHLSTASAAEEAVTYLEQNLIDLVIIHVNMALENEFMILTHLRKKLNLRHTPVIITATIEEMTLVTNCITFGEIDFLPFPIEGELLQHRVIANLEKQQLLNQVLSSLAAFNDMKRVMDDLKDIILPLGIKLSVEKSFDQLLATIVEEAKSICRADMGILYLRVKGEQLQPVVVLNESLKLKQLGDNGEVKAPFLPIALFDEQNKPNNFITTMVALTLQPANIPDVYRYESPLSVEPIPQFDIEFGYRSISCLTVPLHSHELMGVLQLVNAYDPILRKVVPFTLYHQKVLESLASQAAVALQNLVFRHRHEELLHFQKELQIGRNLQIDFLPKKYPQPPGWEIGAQFHPAKEVSGDFYDVFSMRRNKVGLVVADVCDKGMAAALFMALIRTLIRAYGQRNDYYDQKRMGMGWAPPLESSIIPERPFHQEDIKTLTDTIGLTNYYITQNHIQTHLFATLFFGMLDPDSGKMMYINCGHFPPILYNVVSGEMELLSPTGPALGLLVNARFAVSEVEIQPGTILFAYTDGITEARNLNGEMFTADRLESILKEGPFSVDEVIERIETAVYNHIGDTEQIDDITLLAVYHLPEDKSSQ